jgi:hypothetical protein
MADARAETRSLDEVLALEARGDDVSAAAL